MTWIFGFMIVTGIILLCIDGRGGEALTYLLQGADDAVALSIALAGSYMLWSGIMNIAKESGLITKLARLMRKPLELLMPGAGLAIAPVTLNLAANFFGLGNAATPFGIQAMQQLQHSNISNKIGKDYATDNMCMFIALNSSAIELLPTSVIAVRAVCGAQDPYDIVVPTFIASIAAAITAITVCKLLSKIKHKA